jgi:hypothetical protein
MKKFASTFLLFVLITTAASAQKPSQRFRNHRSESRFNSGQLTRPEKFQLRKDAMQYRALNKRVHLDGVVSPLERRRLMQSKRDGRRDLFRYRHNNRRRVI